MQLEDEKNIEIPDDDVVELEADASVQVVDDDDPLNALKAELEKARRERDEVTNRLKNSDVKRSQLEQQVSRYSANEVANSKALIEHAIVTEESRATMAERGYAAAMASGNFAEAAKQQRVMAQAETRLQMLQDGLNEANGEIERQRSAPVQQQQRQQVDPLDGYISQFSPQTQQWLRSHKDDVFANEGRGNMAYAGHVMAVNNGIQPDTEEYFRYLDKHMGYSEEQNGAVQTRKVQASAPPSRNQAINSSSTRVTLTAEEKSTAEALGMTVAEYAKEKARILDGKANVHFSK